jgi:hypothetical protein
MQRPEYRALIQLPRMCHGKFGIVLTPGEDMRLSVVDSLKAGAEQCLRSQFTTLQKSGGGAGSQLDQITVGEGHRAVREVL